MKAIGVTASVGAVVISAYVGSVVGAKRISDAQKMEAKSQGKYVVYNKKRFLKDKADNSAMAFGGEGLKNINAAVVDSKPAVDYGPDWVVQEQVIYHTQFITGCARVEPAPCPGGDVPAPNPESPISDRVPWGLSKIRAVEANKVTSGKDVVVCVADTGSDKNHPDLAPMLIGGRSMIPGSDWQDDFGHGSHVAGTIAAAANGSGIVGVSQAKIYTVKVLDRSGSGTSSWIADGIVDCVNAGAKIINLSLGSEQPDQMIKMAVDYAASKKVYVVAAAGNSGGSVGYPAAYSNVIAVSATDANNRLAQFSSRGDAVDFAAPGVDIESIKANSGGGFIKMSGTSMAAPHVSGALALAISAGKSLKGKNINLPKQHQGLGLVDALDSVK